MGVSKLTVSQKTYDLNYLGKKKKTNLRRKAIIELIQSKPAGEIIKTGEIQAVGQFTTYANAWSFINRMTRDGVIARYESEKPKSYYYAVTGAMRITKPGQQSSSETSPVIDPSTKPTLAEYAKNFAWSHNSDSLRDFVRYMDGKELELRRLADVQ